LNLLTTWIVRARVAARFIPPGARILDCGAGSGWIREVLKKPFEYTMVDREPGGGTNIVLDFNRFEYPRPENYTHGLALGLLEYLDSLPHFVAGVRRCASDWIVSHRPDHGRTHGQMIKAWEYEGFRIKRVAEVDIERMPDLLFVFSRTR
jgi:hypothetical protein